MAVFFPEILDDFLSPSFLAGIRRKFHYGEEQDGELWEVAGEMLPRIREEAFWESRAHAFQTKADAVRYEDVAMSLGSGLDRLQEWYHKEGLLSKSYMLEVLAGELLMRGYGAYNDALSRKTGWHVAGYHFPGNGEDFPLEMLPRLLDRLTLKIRCNAAFCMIPQKSVAFIAELTKDENIRCQGICAGCSNGNCPGRVTRKIGNEVENGTFVSFF